VSRSEASALQEAHDDTNTDKDVQLASFMKDHNLTKPKANNRLEAVIVAYG
jgi:hypothetical protein